MNAPNRFQCLRLPNFAKKPRCVGREHRPAPVFWDEEVEYGSAVSVQEVLISAAAHGARGIAVAAETLRCPARVHSGWRAGSDMEATIWRAAPEAEDPSADTRAIRSRNLALSLKKTDTRPLVRTDGVTDCHLRPGCPDGDTSKENPDFDHAE